jgi:hypothetical protein
MAVNDIIYTADYNNIRNKVVPILGLSSGGNTGYGQAVQSTAVTESSRVTINEWASLRYDLINAYNHQNGSIPSLVQVAEGNTVRYDPTTAPVNQFNGIADSIVTNKLVQPPPSQSITTNKGTASTSWPGVFGNSWSSKIQSTVTVSWSNARAARHFFNSGGEIRFTSTRSGGTSTSQILAWTTILNTAATQSFGGNKPGTTTEPNDGQNFYRLSSVYGTWFSQIGSSPYSSNKWTLEARSPGILDNSNGDSNSIEFRVSWVDDYNDPEANSPSWPPFDAVDGTFSLNVTTFEAYGTLLPAGAGNFSVESPAVTITQIAPA